MMPGDAGYHVPLLTVERDIYNIFIYRVDEIAMNNHHSIRTCRA
jgi:hypothetical protein